MDHVGLISPKMEAIGWHNAPALVEGLRVSNIAAEVHVLHESIDLAATVGADVVYICSGTIGARLWEQAAAAFVADMEPYVAHAEEAGVELGVEPTNPLRSDLSFLFTYRDAVDVARDAGDDRRARPLQLLVRAGPRAGGAGRSRDALLGAGLRFQGGDLRGG